MTSLLVRLLLSDPSSQQNRPKMVLLGSISLLIPLVDILSNNKLILSYFYEYEQALQLITATTTRVPR